MGVLRDVAFHDPGRRGSQGRVSSALTQERHARELPWESSLQGNRKALLADRDLRLQARAAQFLDASPKQLLQETQRLQLENTRLRDKVKLLQSQSTQVCTQRTGRKGGQVSNSFVEEEEEEVEDAEEKSEEAKAVTSLADAELRKVLEESNEAAEEALAAAEVAVITEAVAFVGCLAGVLSSWIGWKMDDSQLPPESKIPPGDPSVPPELLISPPNRIDTTARPSLKPSAKAGATPPQPKATAPGTTAASPTAAGSSEQDRPAVAFPKSPGAGPVLPRMEEKRKSPPQVFDISQASSSSSVAPSLEATRREEAKAAEQSPEKSETSGAEAPGAAPAAGEPESF